jgi:hypothetical protein
MYLGDIVPAWRDLERRFAARTHDPLSYSAQGDTPLYAARLGLRRFNSVRSAFDLAGRDAAYLLKQRFAALDIASVLDDLLGVVTQMATIIVGGALTGGVIGAGAGVFAGGAGAYPLGVAGAAMGLQISTWLLGMLGLTSIAEFFIDGLPRIAGYYVSGIEIAWNGPKSDTGLCHIRPDCPFVQHAAARQIALAHVEVVVLLLGAIVEYLTRGRGDANVLAQQMRSSRKGARLGAWMLKHEDALKKRPDLSASVPNRGTLGPQPPSHHPKHPPGKDTAPPKPTPTTMARHEVECFKADNMPASKISEFERQLKGQEDGLNRLTVDEYLENIANPMKRSPSAARKARRELEDKLINRFQEELLQTLGPREARAQSIERARQTLSNLAGLHNPDLSAGGRDVIADFGDRQVNSSIGPQWRSKIKRLESAAQTVPVSMRGGTYLNVKLHKC